MTAHIHFILAAVCFLALPLTCESLATPMRKKRGGFGSAPPPSPKKLASAVDDGVAEQVARQLFGVCAHLQNPELYQPPWAQQVAESSTDQVLVANQPLERGDIVTLYPVHSLGLRRGNRKKPKGKKEKRGRKSFDYLIYDSSRDGEYFGSKRRTTQFCLDFPALTNRKELRGQALFLDANPQRELVPGWMGHLCERGSQDNSNCVAIPIQGVAPLCMVVATRAIAEGERLVRNVNSNEGEAAFRDRITESGDIALQKYASEIAELKGYTDMAYPPMDDGGGHEEANTEKDTRGPENGAHIKTFKKIDLKYPGIQTFHRDPTIYHVDNFLTPDECDRIIAKCQPHMAPGVTKDGAGTLILTAINTFTGGTTVNAGLLDLAATAFLSTQRGTWRASAELLLRAVQKSASQIRR